jgi:hypothetical protein
MDEFSAISAAAPRIAVDIRIATLLPGRILRITSLTVLAPYDVVRLTYEMAPAMEAHHWTADDQTDETWAPCMTSGAAPAVSRRTGP